MEKEPILGESVYLLHGFLSPDACAGFMDASEQAGYEDAPINTSFGPMLRKDVRNNERLIIDNVELAASWFELAGPYLPQTIGQWSLVGLNERFRFYRYDPGQSFKRHYDGSYFRPNGDQSLVTFMVYLNDGYEGGTTDFFHSDDRLKARVHPRQGSALVFEHQLLHEGTPVVSGRKYVLRTDVMYRRKR